MGNQIGDLPVHPAAEPSIRRPFDQELRAGLLAALWMIQVVREFTLSHDSPHCRAVGRDASSSVRRLPQARRSFLIFYTEDTPGEFGFTATGGLPPVRVRPAGEKRHTRRSQRVRRVCEPQSAATFAAEWPSPRMQRGPSNREDGG